MKYSPWRIDRARCLDQHRADRHRRVQERDVRRRDDRLEVRDARGRDRGRARGEPKVTPIGALGEIHASRCSYVSWSSAPTTWARASLYGKAREAQWAREPGCRPRRDATSALAVPVVELSRRARSRRARGSRSSASADTSTCRPARAGRRRAGRDRRRPPGTRAPAACRPAARSTCPPRTGVSSSPTIAVPEPSRTRNISSSAEWQCGGADRQPGSTRQCFSPTATEPAARPRSRRSAEHEPSPHW